MLRFKKTVLALLLLWSQGLALEMGKVPKEVTIEGKDGGKIDGTLWSSKMLKGKLHVLFYVDPDKRDLNNAFADALKAKQFNRKKLNSVAIINLGATWLPNIILEAKLKEKQKKFPRTLYVKDKRKVLVRRWQLADDNSDILIFNKKGKLIYKKFGKLTEKEIKDVLSLIEKNI